MTEKKYKSPEELESIFYPKSVAVVGTNNSKGTVPHDIFMNILKDDFQGIVYPVSPGEKSIAGVKAYKYIIDIKDPVDMAVIVFPSSVMHLAMEQCGQKGVKSAIIISAGFREVNTKGKEREKQLIDIAEKYGISFIGPNCLGVINTDPESHLNASFARKMPDEGSIGFLSQSGALCTAVLDYAQAKHIGFSKFISFGNKADVNEIDLLYYLKDDPKTKVILIYLEEISDGAALLEVAKKIIDETGKPILALKAGRTQEGAAAAASHTGSLAGSDEICDAAFRQAGIIRCDTIEDMFNTAIALEYQPIPKNNRVAIITNAGGPGVLATDAAISMGLELPSFSEVTTAVLKKHLPATANIKNPVDVIGDARADRYEVAINAALQDDNIDGVLVILTPQSMTDIDNIARKIVEVSEHSEKPLYTSFMGEADVASGIDILQRAKIPHYILPEAMCQAFSDADTFRVYKDRQFVHFDEFKDIDKGIVREILEKAQSQHRSHLPEYEASQILQAYGLPTVQGKIAQSKSEAAAFAEEIGFPVVMKVASDEIVHKSDIGGVILNVRDTEEVETSYDTIVENVRKVQINGALQGILVEKMVPDGEEVILGIKQDNTFGPVVMFGLGGVFVEVLKDVKFRVAPVTTDNAWRMIENVKGYKLLTGFRGKNPRDIDSIVECIGRLSQLAIDFPEIQELDINPLIVRDAGEGCFVADARIMLRE